MSAEAFARVELAVENLRTARRAHNQALTDRETWIAQRAIINKRIVDTSVDVSAAETELLHAATSGIAHAEVTEAGISA